MKLIFKFQILAFLFSFASIYANTNPFRDLSEPDSKALTKELNKVLLQIIPAKDDVSRCRQAVEAVYEYVSKAIEDDDDPPYPKSVVDKMGNNFFKLGLNVEEEFEANLRFLSPFRPKKLTHVIVEYVGDTLYEKYGFNRDKMGTLPRYIEKFLDNLSNPTVYVVASKFEDWAIKAILKAVEKVKDWKNEVHDNLVEVTAKQDVQNRSVEFQICLITGEIITGMLRPSIEVSQLYAVKKRIDWKKNSDLKKLEKKDGLHYSHLIPGDGEDWKLEFDSLLNLLVKDDKELVKHCIRLFHQMHKKQKWNDHNLDMNNFFRTLVLEYHYENGKQSGDQLGKMFYGVLKKFHEKVEAKKLNDLFIDDINLLSTVKHEALLKSVKNIATEVSKSVYSIRDFL